MYSSKNICYNDTSCDCFFITDTCNDNFTCEYDNRFSELTGYDSLSDTTGRDLLKIIHPEDLDEFTRVRDSVSPANPFESLNTRLVRRDHSVVYVRCNIIYTKTDDNYDRLIYAFSILGGEEYFRQHAEFVKSMQPVMFKFYINSRFPFFCNDSFLNFIGYTRQEVETSAPDYESFMDSFDREHFVHAIRCADKSNTISACTIRIYDKSGITKWINCSFKKMTSAAGQEYFIGIGEDITEQKKAESDLRKNRMLLKNITENLSCATLALSENEDKVELINANDGFFRLFGYSSEETEKYRYDIHSLIIHPDDHNEFIHSLMRTDDNKRNVFRALSEGKTLKWISCESFSALENGRPCFICTFHDVTHIKETEAELNALKNALTSSVIESGIFFTADFSENTLSFHELFCQKYNIPPVINNMPEGIFSTGLINESFRETISELYYSVKNGQPEGSCTFKCSLPDRSSAWLKLNLTGIYKSEKDIFKAIGMITDISEQMAFDEMQSEESDEESADENKLFSFTLNLSSNTVIHCSDSDRIPFSLNEQTSYNSSFIVPILSCTFPEDRRMVSEALSLKNLWKNYFDGKNCFEMDFRIKNSCGSFIPSKALFSYKEDATSDSVFLTYSVFSYGEYADITVPEKDPETVTPGKLLPKTPFRAMVDEYISRHENDDTISALYILDLNGFKDISRIHGAETGRRILDEISSSILSLKRPAIAGKMYGDEFLIFIKRIESANDLNVTAKQLCDICRRVNVPGIDSEDITGCVGVAYAPAHGHSFDSLYKKAEVAMYNAKRFDRTQYAIYSENSTYDRRQRNLSEFKSKAAEIIRKPGNVYHLYNADIRHFRNINHILGYETGDKILQEVCSMLQEFLKPGEYFTRIFADNFLLLTRVHDEEDIRRRINEIKYRLHQMNIIEETEINFSSGVVTIDDSNRYTEFEKLIDCAVLAHDSAKKREGTAFVNFVPGMAEDEIHTYEILSELPDAVRNGQICTFVQPQFDILNREYVSMEALVRWNHPVKGMLTPDKFIDICEQNGMISIIDFCVLEQMCSYIRERLDANLRVLPVAVNQSQITIHEKGYLKRLTDLVEKYKIPPEYIELEVTESACVNNLRETISILSALREYGFRISMDDFGTGYSTLNLLKDIPVDALKIDRAFLTENLIEKKPTEIIKSITNMAHNINIRVVCEGVEFPQQLPFLEKIGCELAQGFLFGRPMPYEEVASFIDSSEIPWPAN